MNIQTARRLADCAMIAFICLFPHYAGLPMFIYPAVVLLVCWLYLRLWKQSFKDIGFRFADLTLKSFLVGGAIGAVYTLLQLVFWGPLINRITGFAPADVSAFYFIRHNLVHFLLLLVLAWTWVIPYEEIMFRGFILTKLQQLLPEGKWNFFFSGVLSSFLFGFYHIQEGYSAVTGITIGAFFVTWLCRVFKGNLWYLVFFHAVADTIMLTLIRMGYL
jgi:membrane protease YdiL (CAAX protease family)